MKPLIAYYSWAGHTKQIALEIQKITGGDIFEIEPCDSYPTNYNTCVDQAKKEIAANFRPSLKTKLENPGQYDLVFLGSPVWWYTVAPPVASFLDENDFSGKTLAVFCTHGGGGISRCVTDVAKQFPNAKIPEGIAFRDNNLSNANAVLSDWIKKQQPRTK